MVSIRKKIISKFVLAWMLLCLFVCGGSIGGIQPIQAATGKGTVYVDRQADVVFIIDGTGSMQYVIDSVKENLSTFISSLKADDVDVRVRFSVYRDTEEGEATQVSDWYTDVDDAIAFLGGITANGGGDGPETILDGYGKILDSPDFRSGAAKFFIALTDADYKIDPAVSYTEEGIIDKIVELSINSSVVTRKDYCFTRYGKFLSLPSTDDGDDGGILADIEGDYSILLKDLADKVITVIDDTQAVKIRANMIVLKKRPGQTFAIDGGASQTSCVFKDLQPDTEYEFTVTDPKAGTKTFKLRTEPVTGAQMGRIPNIVYEGETYQIRPNENMKLMLNTPGATIHWSSLSDCLKVKDNIVGNGCEMAVYDCKYNANNLLKMTLVADIQYSVWQKNGTYKMKSARIKQNFYLKNDIDAMDIQEFHGTTDNVYKDGIITLLTKEKVWMDVVFNQGDSGDVASKQGLKYFMSDKYGNKNPKATKIAKVSTKGELTGVAPGVTYLTIAASDSYNKYSRIYGFFVTIPVVCPAVEEVAFNMDEAVKEKPTVIKKQKDSSPEVYFAKLGEALEMKDYLEYNPENVFNKDKMRATWSTTNKAVVSVSKTGKVTFKGEGYATILMSPIGGYGYDDVTGKKTGEILPCSITFKVVEEIKG